MDEWSGTKQRQRGRERGSLAMEIEYEIKQECGDKQQVEKALLPVGAQMRIWKRRTTDTQKSHCFVYWTNGMCTECHLIQTAMACTLPSSDNLLAAQVFCHAKLLQPWGCRGKICGREWSSWHSERIRAFRIDDWQVGKPEEQRENHPVKPKSQSQ